MKINYLKKIFLYSVLVIIFYYAYLGIKSNYNTSLINIKRAAFFLRMPYASSHIDKEKNKKKERYLGAGALYYSLVYSNLSAVSVVIGSGAGFVPQLVAQAQRDAKLKNAVTYLVDAHYNAINDDGHEAGFTLWKPEAQFAENIYTMVMRSSYAAKLFAQENIKIDYLHIDGDHSIKGVLEDWHYYKPLLNKNAIVTFHDYTSVREVRLALEKIKEQNPEVEYIICPDSVGGVAMAQIGGLNIEPYTSEEMNDRIEKKSLLSWFNKSKHTLTMEEAFLPKEWLNNSKDKDRFFRDITTTDSQKRYSIATNFIANDNSSIIEIGGFPDSIVFYINESNVNIVERYAHHQWINKVSRIAYEKGINLTISPSIQDVQLDIKKPNILMFNFDMEYQKNADRRVVLNDVRALFNILSQGNKIIIESSKESHSLAQTDFIKRVFQPKVIQSIPFDFNIKPNDHDSRLVRQMDLIDGINPIQNWDSEEILNEMVNIIINKS